jgi:hypothetical protein
LYLAENLSPAADALIAKARGAKHLRSIHRNAEFDFLPAKSNEAGDGLRRKPTPELIYFA